MICHVSFGRIAAINPLEWLKTVPYYTCILSQTAKHTSVVSIHFAAVDETVVFEDVTYKFIKATTRERILLSKVVRVVRSLNPEAIIVHGLHSSFSVLRFTSMLKRFKIYVQHHGEKVFRFPKSLIQKQIDNRITGYLFSSKELADEWIDADLIRKSDKIFELPEVTSSFHTASNLRKRESTTNFIWVGRLDANKDPITMVDGFISFLKIHPGVNLFMVFSTTELLSEIRIKIADFSNSIHLVGKVPHAEMPKFYENADFIVSTSLYEAGATAVIEGMSFGCVPLLSDIPIFKTISDAGKIGLLFRKGSADALAETLVKAVQLDLPSETNKSLEHFRQHLSASAIADQMLKIVLTTEIAKPFVLQ